MTQSLVGLAIEILVAALLVTTIAYCFVLNRRLTRLRADEDVLRGTIRELVAATESAERSIAGLKATAADADRTLGARLGEARRVSGELSEEVGRAEGVLGRISRIAGVSGGVETVARASAPATARAPFHRGGGG